MTELHLEYRRNTGNPVPDFDRGVEQDYIEWVEELAEKQREFNSWVESLTKKMETVDKNNNEKNQT